MITIADSQSYEAQRRIACIQVFRVVRVTSWIVSYAALGNTNTKSQETTRKNGRKSECLRRPTGYRLVVLTSLPSIHQITRGR